MSKVKRLSHQKEYSIMNNSSDEENMKNFLKILRWFYYDRKTNSRIEEKIDSILAKEKDYLDDLLNLNIQKRAWFSFEHKNVDEDKSFSKYKHYLNSSYEHNKYYGDGEISKFIWEHRNLLYDYSSFLDNKFVSGKQQLKLFKALKSKKVLTQEQIEEITHAKNKDNLLYFCVSRNPIDYIFISTHQSFGSCVNLDGDYPYWLGLPAMVLDPNRFLVFVTKGKISKHSLKGIEFKHFRYLERSWMLLSEKDKFAFINAYPHDELGMDELFSVAYPDIKGYTERFRSKFEFEIPKMEDGNYAIPYIDSIGYLHKNNKMYYCSGGICGTPLEYEESITFEDAESLEDLSGPIFYCEDCGNRYSSEDEIYYTPDDGIPLCHDCFFDNYGYCDDCGETIYREDMLYLPDDSMIVCDYCYGNHAFLCKECGEDCMRNEMSEVDDVCKKCTQENYILCEECGDYVHNEDIHLDEDDRELCCSCYDNPQTKIPFYKSTPTTTY